MSNLETYQVHQDLIYPLLWMQERGLRVDVEGMQAKSKKLAELAKAKQLELNDLVGREINPNSPKQLKEYFYDELRLPPYKKRVGKEFVVTVDEEALKKIVRKGFPAAAIILEIKHALTIKGRYLDVRLGVDGRLHGAFNPVGTCSGRLSSNMDIFKQGTNLQTLPVALKEFLLADKGYIMYHVDKAQAENRIVAYIAPEPNMIDAFERGIDIHRRTASFICRKPEAEVSDIDGSSPLGNGTRSERYFGKQANHALNYKLGVDRFARRLEIPVAEARPIHANYFSFYPGIRVWWNWELAQLKRTGTLTNFFGRHYQFLEKIEEKSLSDALYFIPQSTIADVLNRWGILYVWNNPEFKGLELLNQIHDALVFQIPIELGVEKHFEMVSALNRSLDQPLQWEDREFVIPTDTKMGVRFSEMVEQKGSLDKEKFKTEFERLTA